MLFKMTSSLYDKSVLIGTGVTFLILPMIAVALRFYARSLSRAKLGADDWIMIPALVSKSPRMVFEFIERK